MCPTILFPCLEAAQGFHIGAHGVALVAIEFNLELVVAASDYFGRPPGTAGSLHPDNITKIKHTLVLKNTIKKRNLLNFVFHFV